MILLNLVINICIYHDKITFINSDSIQILDLSFHDLIYIDGDRDEIVVKETNFIQLKYCLNIR